MTPLGIVVRELHKMLVPAALTQADDIASTVIGALQKAGWHHSGDCPECPAEHCEEPGDHGPYGNAQLVEAVQMLHAQAHNEPTDVVYADRCRREPCVTVGGGLVPSSDARGLFAPGSRIVA